MREVRGSGKSRGTGSGGQGALGKGICGGMAKWRKAGSRMKNGAAVVTAPSRYCHKLSIYALPLIIMKKTVHSLGNDFINNNTPFTEDDLQKFEFA